VPEKVDAPPRRPHWLREWWLLITAAVLLFAVTAGVGLYWRRQIAAKQAAEAAAAAARQAAEQAELTSGNEISFSGPVVARNVLAIPAPIDGAVESLEVQPGSVVEQDQPLAHLKNDGLAAEHEAAKAELDKATERASTLESNLIAARMEASRSAADADRVRGEADRLDRALRREEMLFREGATARLKFERAQKEAAAAEAEAAALGSALTQSTERIAKVEADLAAAKKAVEEKAAALEEAKAEADAAIVTAPVDGVILSVNAKVGDNVTMRGADLLQIAVAADELAVNLDPPPPVAERLKDGLPALVNILEVQQSGISGEVKRTEQGKWRVEFKAPNANVKPGLTATVRVKLP